MIGVSLLVKRPDLVELLFDLGPETLQRVFGRGGRRGERDSGEKIRGRVSVHVVWWEYIWLGGFLSRLRGYDARIGSYIYMVTQQCHQQESNPPEPHPISFHFTVPFHHISQPHFISSLISNPQKDAFMLSSDILCPKT